MSPRVTLHNLGLGIVLVACVVSLLLLTGCDGKSPVQLRFKLESESVEVRRLQFYVADIELLRGDGGWQPFELIADEAWQSDRVALLDLLGPQPERRAVVSGQAPKSSYTGVRFSVGVPFDANHGNQLIAAAPLNRAELFWSWQSGYKFFRLELTDQEHASAFHLGSTGCSSASALRPPKESCAQPNVIRVELQGFDPLSQPIAVRVADIVAALQQSRDAACTGDYEREPACAAAFAITGLDVRNGKCTGANGVCSSQRLFTTP
jgi:uncharacterized repeat protein (TIGR04052 family)